MDGYLLGSGGWFPTVRRETCCALFRDGDRALVLDAGTGLARLLERPDLLTGVQHVEILLTHFHLDHIAGLSYLPGLGLPEPPVVWGPGALLYDAPTVEILGRVLSPPTFPVEVSGLVAAVREIPEGGFEAGGFAVATRTQARHADPTLAVRLDDALTYCTDTAFDEGNAGFASGSRLLLHEAWYASDTSDDRGHTAAGDAARVAAQAGVDGLVLIHVSPQLDDEAALAPPARAVFPAAEVGTDLAALAL